MTQPQTDLSLPTFGKLLLVLTLASLALLALGFAPTRRFAGDAGHVAMLAGVAVSWFACAIAELPLVGLGTAATPHLRLALSTGLRLLMVAVLAATVLLSGWLPTGPFLIWVGISYFFLLMTDAVFAVTRLGGSRPRRGAQRAVNS